MAAKKLNSGVEIVVVLVLLTCAPSLIHSAGDNRLMVNMTLVPNSTASALGACKFFFDQKLNLSFFYISIL